MLAIPLSNVDHGLPDPSAVRRDFSKAATVYDTHAALQRTVLRRAHALARAHFGQGGRVLDLGCGTGYLARLHAACGDDWRLVQLDSAEGMARVAASADAPALCADALALPFPAAAFDGVISSLCLQWVGDTARALGEIHRILCPGGKAVLTTLGPDTLGELREAYRRLGAHPHVLDFRPLHRYIGQAAQAGLRIRLHEATHHVIEASDVLSLLRTIRGLGARYKNAAPSVSLRRVMAAYPGADESGAYATFEVYTLLLEKPDA